MHIFVHKTSIFSGAMSPDPHTGRSRPVACPKTPPLAIGCCTPPRLTSAFEHPASSNILSPNFQLTSYTTGYITYNVIFLKWWPRLRKSISGFGFGDVTRLRRSKSICKPNLTRYRNPRSRYKDFLFRNKTLHFDFHLFLIACDCASAYQFALKSGHPEIEYDQCI